MQPVHSAEVAPALVVQAQPLTALMRAVARQRAVAQEPAAAQWAGSVEAVVLPFLPVSKPESCKDRKHCPTSAVAPVKSLS